MLPAQTYVKGFLRSYAEYLGLDGQLYVDEYNSRFVVGEEEHNPARPRRSAPPQSRGVQVQSRVVLLTLLGIGAVTALVIVAWTRGEPQKVAPVGLGTSKPLTTKTQPVTPKVVTARLLVKAVRGPVLAPGASHLRDRSDPLPGDARARTETALHRAQALDHTGSSREPRHDPERPHASLAGRRREDAGRDAARHPSGRVTERPRAFVVVTGSELVRGERTDLNGPFLATQLLRHGIDPARISIVGDRADELEPALAEGLRADVCVVSGGLGPTARRPDRRARGACGRRRPAARRRPVRADRPDLPRVRRAARPSVCRLRDGGPQAGDDSRRRCLARAGRNRAGPRPGARRDGRGGVAGTAGRAAASLDVGARERTAAARARADASARAATAPLLRRERVGRREGARRRRRRRRRGRGDDLRPRFRDPRRPRRRPGRGGAGRRAQRDGSSSRSSGTSSAATSGASRSSSSTSAGSAGSGSRPQSRARAAWSPRG